MHPLGLVPAPGLRPPRLRLGHRRGGGPEPIAVSSMRSLKAMMAQALAAAIRVSARFDLSRRILNRCYDAMSPRQRQWMHGRYSKLFQRSQARVQRGAWNVRFSGRPITLPFSGTDTWLEWDAALSILGHETEIVETYRALLQRGQRPATFLDVGSNYGLQSLLWLVHGVRTISVEPNPRCRAYFETICRLNGVRSGLRPYALSDAQGTAELWFPETETWLGSMDPDTQSRLSHAHEVARVTVPVTTLDACLSGSECAASLLIKIDVEGHEAAVLRGASGTLARYRPWVIFESHRAPTRHTLFNLLAGADYVPAALPVLARLVPDALSQDEFLNSPASNFLALPKEEKT